MKLYIIVFISLLNIFKFFDIININSFNETKINLNKEKRYVIFEFSNQPIIFKYDWIPAIPYPILHIYFKKGNQINTNYYIYYSKENIQLENEKFINSNYSGDLYNKNKTWLYNLESGKIYIVISNFRSNNYEDSITIFNDLEYYDISKINKVHYDIYYDGDDNSYTYRWMTFRINNTNLNYSYLHHEGWPIRYIKTLEESVNGNKDIISLKDYENKIIYLFFFDQNYARYSTYYWIDFETSNYSLLYPLTDIENRTFSHEILGYNSKYTYLFINIADYPKIFYFKINHEMYIKYYFFETNDFELIESKIPFDKDKGIEADEKDLFFRVEKQDNSSIGLVLAIYTSNDIILRIDFEDKRPKPQKSYKKIVLTVIGIVGGILFIASCCIYCYCHDKKNKNKDYGNDLLRKPKYTNKNENDYNEESLNNVNYDYPDKIKNVNYIKGDNNQIINNNTINKETNIDNHIELNKCNFENNQNTQNNIINNNIIINIGDNNQINNANDILDKLMNKK